ncbi:mannose-6-phosphate isomerase-like protein (cupin superfamily) [Catenibacillus scindens]|uniref:Mannose-6-phosphate isomerase-like protein (Cupin superfamily) n=1 Tax=Catenibacillus scindens TaxID=673271 RepID=A0A7W8M568_9FIRM|nr:cupin domain-containing protein [Catenibacillus scindens]MBB5264624.1 mannose-6-phosphate isomerase-like protein (cupin superfamily) [Catenibacillus scindens]
MLINFNEMPERTAPGMNNGIGEMTARMYMGNGGKIIPCRIHAGGSIGNHKHETSDDINYVLSGTGKAICDGELEILTPGCCHICKKGSQHSIINTGQDDLCLLTIVVER